MAELDMTRLLVKGIVHKTLERIQSDPDRSLRNLIDMGLNQAKGRFQHRFFKVAQHMLTHENSPYYQIARTLTQTTDINTLEIFGMNLGYNGLTVGAKTIRSLEKEISVNIPWIISIEYKKDGLTPAAVDGLLASGKKLGIYTYSLFGTAEDLDALDAVMNTHSDCAFLVFISPGKPSAKSLQWLTRHHHVMVSLPALDVSFDETYTMLRDAKCLCGMYATYSDEDVEAIRSGAMAKLAAKRESVLLFLFAEKECSPQSRSAVHAYVTETRNEPRFPFSMIDYFSDLLDIDAVISDQPCFLAVTGNGKIVTSPMRTETAESILEDELYNIILRVMPPVHPFQTMNPAFRA